MAAAVEKRVVQPRYWKGLDDHSSLFDIGIMLNPMTQPQQKLDLLKSSTTGLTRTFADSSAVKVRVLNSSSPTCALNRLGLGDLEGKRRGGDGAVRSGRGGSGP